jgi:hypothetical protein
VGQDGGRYAGDLGEESRTISEKQKFFADHRGGLDRFEATFRRTTDCMLCSQYRVLDWCGLVDVRDAPIATEFCVAEEYRDVPSSETLHKSGRRTPSQV